jgi:hypothetical protein
MTLKLILLAYLLLALFCVPIRRAPVVWMGRLSRAVLRWRVLHQPWRIAWRRAVREIDR